MLIIFSGLPGTGKTTLSRMLAKRIGAVYLRVDTIEAGLKRSMLQIGSAEDAGYQAGCAIAEENLKLGMSVVADSVNPIAISRRLWESAAIKAGCSFKSVEIICSDIHVHRERVESRSTDIEGLILPSWQSVVDREYEAWPDGHYQFDTAFKSPDACVDALHRHLIKSEC